MKADLFRGINLVTSGVSVSRVRHVKSEGLIIGCSSGDSAAALEREAPDKLSKNYTVNEASAVTPSIRIVGMTEDHS